MYPGGINTILPDFPIDYKSDHLKGLGWLVCGIIEEPPTVI